LSKICGSRPAQLLLLAPSAACVPTAFRHVHVDPAYHRRMLSQLQRLRGSVYLQDGAIEPSQLSHDGRHALDVDEHSWHLISERADGRVTGCARYRPHEGSVRPEDLGVWMSALARNRRWQRALRTAVAGEIASARERAVAYVEVGGWAVAPDVRFTPEALDIALSAYALARNLGGCVGITTATTRNCSSRILKKIGGRPLQLKAGPLPSYYDPQYRCEMELLRFDSTALNPRYESRIDSISSAFLDRPVVCATGRSTPVTVPQHRDHATQLHGRVHAANGRHRNASRFTSHAKHVPPISRAC
jgi:hypothetical protein